MVDIENKIVKRELKSFVRREGRWTQAQRRSYEDLGKLYSFNQASSWQLAFANNNDINVLEIGFGMGQSLAHMAQNSPTYNFLGVEVHRPGVSALYAELAEKDINNVRVYADDVIPLLKDKIPSASINKLQIFFPDPWPKRRHHKRRLIQPEFLGLLARCLSENAIIHLATDWQDYAEHVVKVLATDSRFLPASNCIANKHIAMRPKTKFEVRGIKLGHKISDLVYVFNS